MQLALPAELMTAQGHRDAVAWSLPALWPDAPFTQTVSLQLEPSRARDVLVAPITATLAVSGYAPLTAAVWLGLAPAGVESGAEQSAGGAIVASVQADLLLLAPLAAVAAGVSLQVTELYHALPALTPTLTLTASPTLSPTLAAVPTWTPVATTSQSGTPTHTPASMATSPEDSTAPLAPTVTAPTAMLTPILTTAPSLVVSATLTASVTASNPAETLTPTATLTTAALPLTATLTAPTATPSPQPTAAASPAPSPTLTRAAATAGTLFLPLALAGGEASVQQAPRTDAGPTGEPIATLARPTPLTSENVDAYRIWRLDAKQGSQAVQSFDQPLLLFVSAKDLVAQGVDAAQLGLWTRETGDELWTPVAADYDPVQQSFRAALPHFSKFSPGAGLSQPGELLGARPHNRMRAARPLHPHPSSFALALPRRIQCPLHG